MTSSSDSESFRRQLAISELPHGITQEALRMAFQTFGPISQVHLSKHPGIGFVTFEDEMAALEAMKRVPEVQGSTVKVHFAMSTPSLMKWFPVTGHKRQVHFPRALLRTSRHNCPAMNPNNSFKQFLKNPQAHNLMKTGKSHNAHVGHSNKRDLRLVTHVSTILHAQKNSTPVTSDKFDPAEESQFPLEWFPHIFSNVLWRLDSVSLTRSRLVCHKWNTFIRDYVLESRGTQARLLDRWQRLDCRVTPVFPRDFSDQALVVQQILGYRNVTCLKCDELELILGLDNGNVEIYDRGSLKVKTILVGKASLPPTQVEMNAEIFLVIYVSGLGMVKNIVSCQIFDRKTKTFLSSIDHNNGPEFLFLGIDNKFYSGSSDGVDVTDLMNYIEHGGKRDCTERLTHFEEGMRLDAMDIDHGYGMILSVESNEHAFYLEDRVRIKLRYITHASEINANDFLSLPALSDLEIEEERLLKAICLTTELRYPLALCVFSNTNGHFDHFQSKGAPFVLIRVFDLLKQRCLRTIILDHMWIKERAFLPYDEDSGVVCVKFNQDHLVVGFQTAAGPQDGALFAWNMNQVLDEGIPSTELELVSFQPPQYHRSSLEGHSGGVRLVHLDKFQLIAVNACSHQITTSCIERGDKSVKHNVLVHDFWTSKPSIT
ncbi:uncharacterized protein LOC131887700 [Tigriopus californicus]|uniref:uncharacterized protein LOC131887700 n=1 Tax=Tigriopus californicus TaxID=6832 RepID=UPI0027DAAF73|nr:uncharacterized protein LOC131887700 [Tigriopus californicus]